MSRDVSAFDPTDRFSGRAADYVRYRPRYPRGVLHTLVEHTGLTPDSTIADIGSGTGFSAQMFLDYGCAVYGVEPNSEMRQAGEELLSTFPRFTSVSGTAESTSLPDASVDYVIAGQALHWFDLPRAASEFARILRPDGWVAVFWNTRDASTAFMKAYEEMIARYSEEVRRVHHRNVGADELQLVFADGAYSTFHFLYAQEFDADGLVGRTLSASYMPAASSAASPALIADIRALYARFEQNGRVLYQYTTELYVGHGPRHSANQLVDGTNLVA